MLYQDIITGDFSIPSSSIQVLHGISEMSNEIIIRDQKYIEQKTKEANDLKFAKLFPMLTPHYEGQNVLSEDEIKAIKDSAPILHHYVSYEMTDKPNCRPNQYIVEVAPVNGKQVWQVLTKPTTAELIASFKKDLKQRITAKRWEVEASGITLPNGIKVATKPEDQARLMSIIVGSTVTPIDTLNFKSEGGIWVQVDVATVKQIYAAGVQFVQFCFNTEHTHHSAVDALTDIDAIIDYDINKNWDLFTLSY